MPFVVVFEDNADVAAAVRATHLPAHLAFLERNAATVTAAGPLADPSGTVVGGLWLVAADSAADVDTLVKQDPFWPTGLRRGVRILAWTKVFEAGRILI